MQTNVAFYEKINHLCFMEEIIRAGSDFRLGPEGLGLGLGHQDFGGLKSN